MPLLSACRCPALHVACCPRPPLFSCRRPRRRCRRAPLLLNQSSSPDAVITISPLVPPLFVDCCFKRRTKPLLPTMVPSLSSRLPSLVGCFRCPPPPTLAASHGRRHQPHSRHFGVTVVVVLPSSLRCRQRSSTSAELFELSQRDSWLGSAILRFLGEGQCTIAIFVCASSSSLSSS